MEVQSKEATQMSCETPAHASIVRRIPMDLKSVVARTDMPRKLPFGRTPSTTKEILRQKLSPQQETYWNYVLHKYAESRCIYFSEDRLNKLHKQAVADSKAKETDAGVIRSIFAEVYTQIGKHMQIYHSAHKKRIEESLQSLTSDLSYHVLCHRAHDDRAKSQAEFVHLFKRLSRFVASNRQHANHSQLDSLPPNLRDNFAQILSAKLRELQIEAQKADGTTEIIKKRMHELMTSILGPPLRTVHEIRTIFHNTMKWVLDDMESIATERRHPEVWDAAKWVLILQMKAKLREALMENVVQIKHMDRTFEKAFENCSVWYHEDFESHATLLQDERHRVATETTEAKFRAFCDNMRVEPAIWKYWWKCLKIMLDKWGAKYNDQTLPSANHSRSSSMEDGTKLFSHPSPCRVAIYVSENVIQMSMRLPDSSIHSVKYSPFISVENDAIRMIDAGWTLDATKDQSYFNIYQVINSLPNPQKSPQKLEVKGNSIDVGHNEAVVLFFHQLKKKMEMKNPIEYDRCVVLFSNLFPASARQCLSEVLSIIGFGKVEFLPLAVTAALMDHRDSTVKAARPYSMLFLLQTGTLFEASKVKVSADVIEVTQTEGYFDNVDKTFDGFISVAVHKVRSMLDDKKKGLKDVDKIILFHLDHSLESADKSIKRCFQPTEIVNSSEQLISIAVEMSAHGNDSKSFPRYTYLVPWNLCAKNYCFKFTKDCSIVKSLGKHRKSLKIFQTPSYQKLASPSQFCFSINYGNDKTEKCEIEMTMTKSGCFSISTRKDRSSISCPLFKFLTKQDLNDLKDTYQIFKHDFDSNLILITGMDT